MDGVKRLAVHVEDHPIEYGRFHGTIPKGQYGAGEVRIWDRGRWVPDGDPRASYEKGHLSFELKGRRLKGSFRLIRMGGRAGGDSGKNWLLFFVPARAPLPERTAPAAAARGIRVRPSRRPLKRRRVAIRTASLTARAA
jgi:bifunctional non-homologous end joining protein LigD